jgi:hypothetical protein
MRIVQAWLPDLAGGGETALELALARLGRYVQGQQLIGAGLIANPGPQALLRAAHAVVGAFYAMYMRPDGGRQGFQARAVLDGQRRGGPAAQAAADPVDAGQVELVQYVQIEVGGPPCIRFTRTPASMRMASVWPITPLPAYGYGFVGSLIHHARDGESRRSPAPGQRQLSRSSESRAGPRVPPGHSVVSTYGCWVLP